MTIRIFAVVFLLSACGFLVSCGDTEPDPPTNVTETVVDDSPQTSEHDHVFKTQAEALDRAKSLEAELNDAVRRQLEEIDQMSGAPPPETDDG